MNPSNERNKNLTPEILAQIQGVSKKFKPFILTYMKEQCKIAKQTNDKTQWDKQFDGMLPKLEDELASCLSDLMSTENIVKMAASMILPVIMSSMKEEIMFTIMMDELKNKLGYEGEEL